MFRIKTHNAISPFGLERFDAQSYEVGEAVEKPDALLLRSYVLPETELASSILAIGRAGAGVNNIPLEACTARAIPVFNAPGANANAVKELVLTALLLGSRGITRGIDYVATLNHFDGDDKALGALLEKEKKSFKGSELIGKTLGVVGLGAIGSMVAEAALQLGMKVVGYDPALSIEAAWRLSSEVKRMENLNSLLSKADFVTLHLPVLEATRHLINAETLKAMKPGAVLLNFAREQIVDTDAVIQALDQKALRQFITDFPTKALIQRGDDVILMPHIGASTCEAEDNCAIMVADQLKDYLQNGNIKNAVNFPNVAMEAVNGFRLCITNQNIPKMLGNITSVLADENINVIDMLNKSRNDIAYNLIDIENEPTEAALAKIAAMEGVIGVRLLK